MLVFSSKLLLLNQLMIMMHIQSNKHGLNSSDLLMFLQHCVLVCFKCLALDILCIQLNIQTKV